MSVAELELEVAERSARRVLVFEGLRFETLQTAVPPSRVAWKIEPGQLGRAGRLACGKAASLALVRRIEWDQAGPTHHVILLPKALFVAPGEKARLATPAPLLIGDAALDATPNHTQVPMTIPSHGERTSSFRLGDVEKCSSRSIAWTAFRADRRTDACASRIRMTTSTLATSSP